LYFLLILDGHLTFVRHWLVINIMTTNDGLA